MRDRYYALSFCYFRLVYKLNIYSYLVVKAIAVYAMVVHAIVLFPEHAVLKGK